MAHRNSPYRAYTPMEPPAIPMSQINSRPNTGSTWSHSSRYTERDLERQDSGDEVIPLTHRPRDRPQVQDDRRNTYYTPFEGETGVWGYYNRYSSAPPSRHDANVPFPASLLPGSYPSQIDQQTPSPTRPAFNKAKRKIERYKGHYVLDCKVPAPFLDSLPEKRKTINEFMRTRYTAATCDPADFKKQKFDLRQQLSNRRTEIFIVITLYNEDDQLFLRTMRGVLQNIAYFCSLQGSEKWGEEGWQKIVVCIVADGRKNINQRTLSALGLMGVYQDGYAKNTVPSEEPGGNEIPVTAHIFEYTTQITIDKSPDSEYLKIKPADEDAPPCQIIFCLKEKNQKKLNSHRWFFQAFGPILQPNICVLIDAGTKPGKKSIYELWAAFARDDNIAGACGEIVAMKGKKGKNLLNPLVSAQYFEYKMSNILDKPLESVFGFISVLPGAFSAYRYTALQNDHKCEGPLASYFKGESLHDSKGIFEANMYLAEDRILCFELVAKRHYAWTLHFVKSAYATTDVPNTLDEWISQRKRWLNGSFFAALYAIAHAFTVFRTGHSIIRKLMFQVEFLYQAISLLFSWFALANFYLIFVILTGSMADPAVGFSPGNILSTVFNYIYVALLIMCFVLSLGNRPQGSKMAYMGTAIFFAVVMFYMLFCSIWLTVKGIQETLASLHSENAHFGKDFRLTIAAIFQNKIFRDLILSTLSTYALYLFSSLLFLDFLHMFTSFAQYLFLSPSYTNILNVYAFCNTHNLSWGTKGDTDSATNVDLGRASKSANDDNMLHVELPTQRERDANYQKMESFLGQPPPKDRTKRSRAVKTKDYQQSLRTRVVLAWIMSNLLLVFTVLYTKKGGLEVSGNANNSAVYLTVVLWSVAALAAIRFVGAMVYLILSKIQGRKPVN